MTNLAHEHLTTMTEAFKELGAEKTLYGFVLEHGIEYTEVRHAEDLGTPKECYSNAARSLINGVDVTYVEGYIISEDLPIPILHAWLVDAEGVVIETTLARDLDKTHYFGVPFKRDFVLETMMAEKVYGILGGAYETTGKLIEGLDPAIWKEDC